MALTALGTGLVGVLHRTGVAASGQGPQAASVVLALGLVVALLVLAGRSLDLGTAVAAVGVVVVVVGSGLGRWHEDDLRDVGRGGGDVVARTDVRWPIVALGVAVLAAGVVRSWRRPGRGGGRVRSARAGLVTEALGLVVIAATMGEVVVGQWIEGRPRRRRGRRVPHAGGVADPSDPCVADVWADAARAEAEAVGAFRDLAARLEAADAPAVLVARSRRAAHDEVRHARLCRSLAGRAEVAAVPRPGAAPRARSRTVEIVRLAIESYVDGVVGEGTAAGRLERGATTAAAERASVLRSIARDERSHAALGADVVRWCATQHPVLVRAGVRAAARRMPSSTAFPASHAAHRDADLRAAGLVDRRGAEAVWRTEAAAALVLLDDLV